MVKKCRLSTFGFQVFQLICRGKNSHNDFTLEIQMRTDEAVPGGLLLFFLIFHNWRAHNGSLSRLIHFKNLKIKNRLSIKKTDISGGKVFTWTAVKRFLEAKQEENLGSVRLYEQKDAVFFVSELRQVWSLVLCFVWVYVCACTREGVGDLSPSLTRLWPAEMIQE